MTSNLGSQVIRERFETLTPENRAEVIENTRNEVFALLKTQMRPEFLNRIDDIIMFTPLDCDEIGQIVRLQVNGVAKMLAKNGIDFRATDAAIAFIANAGYNPEFGARPVKRVIQNLVLNRLSKDIIAQKIDRTKPIIIDLEGEDLVFRN